MTSARGSGDERFLFPKLDKKLLASAIDLVRNSVLPERPAALTIETFLFGLYARYPEETSEFFVDPEPFVELARKFYPVPLRDRDHLPPEEFAYQFQQKWTALAGESMALRGGMVPALSLKLDPTLVEVLQNAIKIARAAGLEKAGLLEFVSALTSDHELVNKLYKETGLLPRGFRGTVPER